MRGIHLGQRPTTTTPGGGASNRITFTVLDDVLYLFDPISGYTWEAPVTFVGPTTLPSGLITASEDTLLFHYSGGTWQSPATVAEGSAPPGGSIVNDRYFVTIGSTTYEMPVTAVDGIPGMPPGGETSLVVIDDVEYLRIVFPDGEVRYEEVHETPTPDADAVPAEGGGSGATISVATDYTGGAPTGLDGEVTVGVSVPRIYNFKHVSLGWRQYLLRAGTDAEASPNVIRPDDYAASTNEKVFELMF